jgi:hypothetical protein
MNQPVLALAAVAAVVVVIFILLWVRDARRSDHEEADAGRLDVETPPRSESPGTGHQ